MTGTSESRESGRLERSVHGQGTTVPSTRTFSEGATIEKVYREDRVVDQEETKVRVERTEDTVVGPGTDEKTTRVEQRNREEDEWEIHD